MKRTTNKKSRNVPKRVKIICEGKAEKFYLEGLKNDPINKSKLRGAVIKPEKPKKGQSLDQLLKEAKNCIETEGYLNHPSKRYQNRKKYDNPYDEIWIIVDHDNRDRDHNENFKNFFDQATSMGLKIAFSNRCFEYWLLIHFEFKCIPFEDQQQLKKELKKKLPSYEDELGTLYEKTKNYLTTAKDNAVKVREKAKNDSFDLTKPYDINPITFVDCLVDSITEIND